jgi:uncharacterized protein
MIQLTDITFDGLTPIDGYGPGFFRVGGKVLHGPVLIASTSARIWGGYGDTAPLIALAGEIDVLFLGTGKSIAHPPAALREALEEAGMGVEAMATDAAARTYNVLLSEGRRIAAALLPVE